MDAFTSLWIEFSGPGVSPFDSAVIVRNRVNFSPCDRACHSAIFSRTAPFWIASHFDLAGTAHHPVTIQLPDLNDLAAQTAPVPGASLAKPPGWPQVTNPLPGSGSLSVSGQICSLPIPLITLVAMFLFELFLPVVVLVFGLFWMLLLKFCIPPDISVAAGLTAELDVDMEASLEASLTLEGGISLTDSVHASLVANFADPAAVAKLEADYTPIAIANWELASSRATAPDPNAGLEYEAEVPHP